jgi:hypothetical protein
MPQQNSGRKSGKSVPLIIPKHLPINEVGVTVPHFADQRGVTALPVPVLAGSSKKELEDFRKTLVDSSIKAQDDWDKTIITLASASLGLSITFVKDITGSVATNLPLLQIAWGLWGFSLIFVLLSFSSSYYALRKAIFQVDELSEGKNTIEKIGRNGWFDRLTSNANINLGGWLNRVTYILNTFSGTAYILGLVLFLIYVIENLQYIHV